MKHILGAIFTFGIFCLGNSPAIESLSSVEQKSALVEIDVRTGKIIDIRVANSLGEEKSNFVSEVKKYVKADKTVYTSKFLIYSDTKIFIQGKKTKIHHLISLVVVNSVGISAPNRMRRSIGARKTR